MVVTPKLTAVTNPEELIVATAGFNENHGVVAVIGAGSADADNWVVLGPGKHILKLPVITFACTEATVRIVTIRK